MWTGFGERTCSADSLTLNVPKLNMKHILFIALICTLQTTLIHPTIAQPGGISQVRRMDENTKIFDKDTGKRVSLREFNDLLKADPYAQHLVPNFNEYGEVDSYTLRPTTPEEKANRQFNDRDPALRPKMGQPMPEFVMKGIDDKAYRLSELKGHVVILSFWLSLKKPFWNPKQVQAFADAVRSYQSETDPISLGVLQDQKEKIVEAMASETLPFVPIPNSYGFTQKFHVTTGPTFIVIDRVGKVVAYIEGYEYDQLKKVLQGVSR